MRIPKSCDVLVVGAGPAGLSVTSTVARAGFRVVVIDRTREVGTPVRSSGCTFFKEILNFGIPKELMNPAYRVTFVTRGASVTYESKVPHVAVLDVRGLYQYLAERAVEFPRSCSNGSVGSPRSPERGS